VSTVDVVVPCYNYGRYLKGCVDSALSQRDVDVRVLIIDDASPDNTPAVAEQLAAADKRVSYVRNEVNLGLIPTANKGVIDWATADYVVLLSADDALTPGSLARATKLLDARPDVVLTYGMALMMHDGGQELATGDPRDPEFAVVPGALFLRRMFEYGNAVPSPCAVMRTSVQHRIAGYNPLFKHTSDVDMWMRAAAVGSIGVVNAVQGLYRWHESNMSAAYMLRPVGDRAEVLATCEEFFKVHGKEFPEAGKWLKLMKRRFADESILIASKSFGPRGDKTWRDTLEFAKKCQPRNGGSAARWKFLWRSIGRHASTLTRHVLNAMGLRFNPVPTYNRKSWYDHGMQIGWWPEEFRRCRRWGPRKRREKSIMPFIIEGETSVIKKFVKNALGTLGYEIHKLGSSAVLDRYNSSYLSRLCQPRTVFDVGVGFGTFPLYEAFPNAFFILVEPLTEYKESINAILAKYRGEVCYEAVGNEEGRLEINVEKSNIQMSSAFHRTELTRSGRTLEKREVGVTTLDAIFRNAGSKTGPILLKIDTEGNELHVLEGAKLLLQSTDFVIAEVSVARRFEGGYKFEELVNWMDNYGFRIFSFLHIEHEENELRPRFVDVVFSRK
jgi:FkbM family methyltransferase